MSSTEQPFPPCPVCNKAVISFSIHSKDYSLTANDFDIIECKNCSLRYTFPMPSKEAIGPYYDFPEYISHTDVKVGWMNKIYHKVRTFTLHEKTKWIQSLFTGHKGQILELGAGTGAFAHAMKIKGWSVTALEPDAASRQRCLDTYGIQLQPIENLYTLSEKKFEVITLWHVLEHVHDLKDYFQAFSKLLKPNGRLIIAVPNYTSYDAFFYKKYWAAYDVPRHLYHFSPAAMNALVKQFNMQIVEYKPMWFDSFYVSLLSEKYKKSGALGVARALIIGCISNIKALSNPKKASSLIYQIKKLS
jgi:2-polyprenyl-3-methyl-5-hydroxy-6-metoxy-1,4-benzoquinol methylase